MAQTKKKASIDLLLGEAQSVFVELEEIQIPALEDMLKEIKKRCDAGYAAMEKVHEHLGLYKKAGK